MLSLMAKKVRKKMGRPPKPPAEKCSVHLMVHMTQAERKMIEAAAVKTGQSLSTTIMRPWRERKG